MRWRETDSQTKRNDEQIDVDRSERDQSEKKVMEAGVGKKKLSGE